METLATVVLMTITTVLIGKSIKALHLSKRRKRMNPYPLWETLPSGWSKNYGNVIGYAIRQDSRYYWWLQRGNKTLIEGPARTLELAQYEVEAAAGELRREA